MICKNCGTEFSEGIFCPECGTKIEMPGSVSDDGREIEAEKTEQEIFFKEKLAHEAELAKQKAEQERLAKEKISQETELAKQKTEQERLAKEKAEIEARTFNGVTYTNEKEARQAREENSKIDLLKQKLELTKSQEKRQQILSEFKDDIQTVGAKERLEKLRFKANQPVPSTRRNNHILGGVSLVVFVIGMILCIIEESDVLITIGAFAILFGMIGLGIWLIRVILLSVQSKTKKHYLYIKDI